MNAITPFVLSLAIALSGLATAAEPGKPGSAAKFANTVDTVTLCWFNGKVQWGKVGTLHDGIETPWLKGATPPETPGAKGGPFGYSAETISTGTIAQWNGSGAPADFPITAGDKLFVYVLLDAKDPPLELMFQLHANNSYANRAFWGAVNKVTHCDPIRVGALPEAGKWIRLEVDPAQVGQSGTFP